MYFWCYSLNTWIQKVIKTKCLGGWLCWLLIVKTRYQQFQTVMFGGLAWRFTDIKRLWTIMCRWRIKLLMAYCQLFQTLNISNLCVYPKNQQLIPYSIKQIAITRSIYFQNPTNLQIKKITGLAIRMGKYAGSKICRACYGDKKVVHAIWQ